jgi:hypothetical protein
MKIPKKIMLLLSVAFLFRCTEIKTNEPIESYKYWAGSNPSGDIKVLNGNYWQSAHWSKEYILYLRLKTTDVWCSEFIKQNDLVVTREDWVMPQDAPEWFHPNRNCEIYKRRDNFYSSRYFRDKATGECYIYDIQL